MAEVVGGGVMTQKQPRTSSVHADLDALVEAAMATRAADI